ncbi:MAG: T9SS type B sorting domain-containing protein [Saprospiraceae bacterium]|nr:T9SS type B sorting domain-containing protein [Saprospiraceae bacterium]
MRISLGLFFSFLITSLFAQPRNDACVNAIALPSDNWCSEVRAFTISDATPSLTQGQTCSELENSTMKDVWFEFTALGNYVFFGITTLEVPWSSKIQLFTVTFYTGKCQEMVLDRCILGDADFHWIYSDDFVPGQTYLARIATSIDSLDIEDPAVDSLGNFGICIDSYSAEDLCNDLTIFASNDTLIDLGKGTQLSATVNSVSIKFNYQWFEDDSLICDDCQTVEVYPESNTSYVVLATNDLCFAQSDVDVNVRINNVAREVFIPNAFTPNGDFINDRATVFGSQSLSSVRQLDIYNRWGELVFREYNLNPNDETQGWDGNQHSNPAPNGIYAYVAIVEFVDSSIQRYSGSFHLIR